MPNKISLLKPLGINADKIVNFGWFDIIAKPMLWGMNFANRYTHNYGIDIILLTILIKIIFYPLSLKSYKSMKNMQKLQPKIAQLREKYKNDKEKLNQEMMGIYKKEGINPLGGCLPMVIQIPVFFALYRVLMAAIEFRHAPFMLWINDLAGAGGPLHPARGGIRPPLAATAPYHGRHDGDPAEDDAHGRRPHAGEDDDVHAHILHLPLLGVPGRPRPLLAREQRDIDRSAVLHQQAGCIKGG